ncbi:MULTISPECIES: ArsR/SmtB family transcription factor [Halolamina]|uniref:Helix-turn-helix domain-containing protein n=1 Tax=Halolamina pelagica TaxID=699431 RepID=A0A1I5MGJ4_9EURY|nr:MULTISPECIES: winged helix-turn-helix domain-containing protein [Halolamina]NHX36016.1 helix-turn-helix transcriptional regulator [Halolamina sp. R1-12]SFP08712.1 Helix-turn-helix domain-containing protein [Halolamina pelagica]
MVDILPSTPDADPDPEPRVLGVDSDEAGETLAALSSETARGMLREFHDDPATPSGIADRLDLSLQNAQYHIGNLEDAGLIEPVDTVYSEKGREMTVYGPADAPLIVYAGTEDETTGLKAALSRLIGAVAALGITSLLVQAYLGDLSLPFGTGAGGTADHQAGTTATQVETETEGGMGIAQTTSTPEPTATPVSDTVRAAEDALALPPGVLFFLGGLAVLLGVGAGWWLKNR